MADSAAARLGQVGLVVDGRYRLDHLLGAGGFGEVWKASQEVEGSEVRPVALKLLYAPESGAAGSGAPITASGSGSLGSHRWLDEVRAVRDVRCESIATIFDVGISREPRMAFIAMELLRGETLDARLRRGVVYWRRALAIARRVASALVACHRVDVSHCDLKPQNVFLSEDGEVFVLDFGVAALGNETLTQRARRAEELQRSPATGDPGELFEMGATGAVELDEMPAVETAEPIVQLVGTPGYIAPESYSGEPPGPASDVYALGIVLYRMIANRLPHRLPADVELPTGRTTAASYQRYQAAINLATVREDYEPLTEVAPDVPDAVAAFVASLYAHDPAERPTARLLEELDEVLHRPYGVPDPPYVGLEAFDQRRAGYIAGRDADIEEVAAKLAEHRAVVLCGPSGCGKSSLAIAGVAPYLDEELLLGVDGWRMLALRPSEGPAVLRMAAAERARAQRDDTGLVVVVDQLEEVVRLDDEEREAFCEALATLVEGSGAVAIRGQIVEPERPVRVIATVRDDLFGPVAALPELRRFPEQNLYTVRGVEPNAISSIVEGPARAAGYELEAGAEVVAEAMRILGQDAGALPLVQFALTRWWQARDTDSRRLPRAEWEKIGGIEGALAEAAQTLHDSLDESERGQMRSLLLALFGPDGTRVRVEEEVVVRGAAGRSVLARLLEQRLVTRQTSAERGAILEVVHEALGRRWPLLHTWLEETRTERELIHDARYDAERWKRAGRPHELLWRGRRLDGALALRDRLGEAAAFIDAAERLEGKRAWTRRGVVGLLAALVAVAVVLVLSYVASNRERVKADEARSVAESERKGADQARVQAEAALKKNVALRNEAEAARARAIAEQDRAKEQQREAERARAEAQQSAEINAGLRRDAEDARQEAIRARVRAEEAMREAQAEKREVEIQRREAETQRKYAETAQRLHELARKRMERIERQYETAKKERGQLRQQLGACRKEGGK